MTSVCLETILNRRSIDLAHLEVAPVVSVVEYAVSEGSTIWVGEFEQPALVPKSFSVDSHRNILAEARSFLRWCSTKRKWIARNPLEEVEGVGKRKHGKAQLRVDEARRWVATAVDLADGGEREP